MFFDIHLSFIIIIIILLLLHTHSLSYTITPIIIIGSDDKREKWEMNAKNLRNDTVYAD